MKEQFASLEQSKKLKDIGFKGICVAFYDKDGEFIYTPKNKPIYSYKIPAPLWQQAFDWFRKNYNLYSVIIPTVTMHWTFKITTVTEDSVETPPYKEVNAQDYSTYEEARSACLSEMMKLVEEQELASKMKATELRLGNYFWNYVQKIPAKVDVSVIQNQLNAEKGFRDPYKPLELTKEILLKCGFEQKSPSLYVDDSRLSLWVNSSLKGFLACWGEEDIGEYNYLHELQNLYHALTGEELKVNL